MPESLYLTGFKKALWANTVKAVRDVRGIVYNEENPSIKTAHDIVKEMRETLKPVLVAEHDDPEVLTTAAALLSEVDALWELNPVIERAENVLPEGDDAAAQIETPDGAFMLTVEGIKTTLVTLMVAKGSPATALVLANTYLAATDDPIWDEVRGLLIHTFPADPSHNEAPVVIVGDDGSDPSDPDEPA